jgi:hypothetical protein
MKERTVRELGGEIWAEITTRMREKQGAFTNLDVPTLNATIDLIMGVLARYNGVVIVNDPDLPVIPLPQQEDKGGNP